MTYPIKNSEGTILIFSYIKCQELTIVYHTIDEQARYLNANESEEGYGVSDTYWFEKSDGSHKRIEQREARDVQR